MVNQRNKSFNITDMLVKNGITNKNFISHGYFLELVLLSAVRADGLSNLGYEYTDCFIVKLGNGMFNSVFRRFAVSNKIKTLFSLKSNILYLDKIDWKYKQLSLLENILLNNNIDCENIECFNIKLFVDITTQVSFTLNRSAQYIRSLKDLMINSLMGITDKSKSKENYITSETDKSIQTKKEEIEQLYGQDERNDMFGNINTKVRLGEKDLGISFYSSEEDVINAEFLVYVSEQHISDRCLGLVRISVINTEYDPKFEIDNIMYGEENNRALTCLYDDFRAGFNFVLGVLDAWSSLRVNRENILF